MVDSGKVAANKVAEVATATGEAVSDGWITTKLKAKFADEVVLNGSDITVDTKDHAVTLSGSVLSPQAKTRAVEIANGTEGVRLVVSHIVVK
jgi:osmotically-inducible protein OsmY